MGLERGQNRERCQISTSQLPLQSSPLPETLGSLGPWPLPIQQRTLLSHFVFQTGAAGRTPGSLQRGAAHRRLGQGATLTPLPALSSSTRGTPAKAEGCLEEGPDVMLLKRGPTKLTAAVGQLPGSAEGGMV